MRTHIDPHGFIETMGTAHKEFVLFVAGYSGRTEWKGMSELDWCREFGLVTMADKDIQLTDAGRSIADALEEADLQKERSNG